ncbi:hypothetical protein LTR97_012517 [Elasticomyces elasticus]|uniref:Uncharacterized protein n=1 Tax=Elasticomyces elasticus TaxID=574655 RepID=A0AAN7W1T3_9PEZI|nr:hypothetical protein LTR97_012517 [Elasticomyces elasticus]
MCVIERRTYQRSDNREEIHERVRRCRRVAGSTICRDAEIRTVDPSTRIDRRPSNNLTNADDLLVTEGFNGRRNVYREVDTGTRRRGSVRRSNTINTPSPLGNSSPRSSDSYASYVERRPEAPSPPAAASMPPRPINPLRPTSSDTAPARTVRPDGTAVYDRPPPLDTPRARDNERRTRFADTTNWRTTSSSDSSISSITAEVDDIDTTVRVPRRPSMSINTARLSPTSSSPGTASPGLSQLPRLGSLRHDSVRDTPRDHSRQASIDEWERRRRQEDDRLAQLERDRAAETDRRQQAREEARRSRHRAEAAAALEGESQPRQVSAPTRLEAELAQMARERAEAAAREAEAEQPRYAYDQLRRDADAVRHRESQSTPRILRRNTGEISGTSALSTRLPAHPVTIHQPARAPRDSTLEEQGEAIIAREQARGTAEASSSRRTQQASRRLSSAMGDLTIDGTRSMNVEVDLDADEVDARSQRRADRKAQKAAERAERRGGFWK